MRKAEFEMRNDEEKNEEQRETEEQEKKASAIDVLQLRKWTKELTQYKAGKANLESRVRSAENWWKLRMSARASSGSPPMSVSKMTRSMSAPCIPGDPLRRRVSVEPLLRLESVGNGDPELSVLHHVFAIAVPVA